MAAAIFAGSAQWVAASAEARRVGLFRKRAPGEDWAQLHKGLPDHVEIRAIAVNPDDATGLTRSSLIYLADARWRRQSGSDPGHPVAEGITAVDRALSINPQLASAHLRRAELLVVLAEWDAANQRSAAEPIEQATASLATAAEINPNDATIGAVEAEIKRLVAGPG